jgi:hypothetical protein
MTSATGETAVGMAVGVKRVGCYRGVGLGVADGGGMGVGVGLVLPAFVGLGFIAAWFNGMTVGVGVSLPKVHAVRNCSAKSPMTIRNLEFILFSYHHCFHP